MIWTSWALFLAGLQTTVWPLIVGGVPAPQLWLNLILYFILFRPMMTALLLTYALGVLWSPFTSLSLGVFWTSFLFLVPLGSSIKSRTFWPGVRYFLIGSFMLAFGWHVTSFTVSQIFEPNPASAHLFTRITDLLLTPLAASPQYHIMQWLDRLTQDEPEHRFGGAEE